MRPTRVRIMHLKFSRSADGILLLLTDYVRGKWTVFDSTLILFTKVQSRLQSGLAYKIAWCRWCDGLMASNVGEMKTNLTAVAGP